jgi:outer membrane protein
LFGIKSQYSELLLIAILYKEEAMIPFNKGGHTYNLVIRFMGIVILMMVGISPVRAESSKLEPFNNPLSLRDCIKIALETNPVTQTAVMKVLAAKEASGEARSPFYPQLGLQTRYAHWQQRIFLPKGLTFPGQPTPTIVGPTDDWMGGLRARYTLFDSGERWGNYQAALAKQGVTEEEKVRIIQDLVLGVQEGFYGLAAAMEILSVAEKNLDRAKDHLRLAKERKAAGAVSQADVLRVQVETSNSELALVRAESLLRISKGSLNTVMGLPIEGALIIEAKGEDLPSPNSIDLSKALEQAIINRPEIKAAQKRIEAQQSNLQAAKSAYGPKLFAEGSYGRRDTEFFPQDVEWLVGVSIEWPLFTGFFRQHHLARTKAEVSKEEAEAKQLILKVKEEVWAAHSKLQEAFGAVHTTKILVEDAQESMRMAKERYEAGAGTITDLLDAQTSLARAQATQVEAGWDYHTANAVFKRSIGLIEDKI